MGQQVVKFTEQMNDDLAALEARQASEKVQRTQVIRQALVLLAEALDAGTITAEAVNAATQQYLEQSPGLTPAEGKSVYFRPTDDALIGRIAGALRDLDPLAAAAISRGKSPEGNNRSLAVALALRYAAQHLEAVR